MARLSLVPRDRRLFDLLSQHVELTARAAAALSQGMADSKGPTELQAFVKQLEHQGDDLTHETVETINRTFVPPFDREDIHQLVSAMDDVLDLIEEVADTLALYRISVIPPLAVQLAEYIAAATAELKLAVEKLGQRKPIAQHGMEVDRLENLGDQASRQAIGDLFADGLDAVAIIKLKDLYAVLEATLDRCEDVADILESVTIKNA